MSEAGRIPGTGAAARAADGARARGLALCRARRFGPAALAFAQWLEAGGGAEAALLLARALLLAGQPQRAQDVCRRALALDPGALRCHLLLARIATDRGNAGPAIQHLRNALAHRPEAASLRARLAGMLLERNQVDAALRTAREAVARDPACHAAALVVARCHLARGDAARARLAASRLARVRPGWSELAAFQALLNGPASAAPPETLLAAAEAEARDETPGAAPPGEARAETSAGEPQGEAPGIDLPPLDRGAAQGVRQGWRAAGWRASGWRMPRPGLADHLLIIRALILRNLRLKYRGNPFGLLQELVRPVAVVAAHYVLFDVLRRPMPGEIPITAFVLAGFSVWFAFNYTAQGAMNGANWPGGATMLGGVTRMHLRLARAAWPFLVMLVFCLTAMLPLRLLGADLPLPNLPWTVLIFSLAGLMGLGFGLLAESMGRVWSVALLAEKLLIWALFVTCGLYFVVDRMLPVLADVLLWNPLLHLVEYERRAFDPGYPVALVDLQYPALVAAILLVLGLAASRAIGEAE